MKKMTILLKKFVALKRGQTVLVLILHKDDIDKINQKWLNVLHSEEEIHVCLEILDKNTEKKTNLITNDIE